MTTLLAGIWGPVLLAVGLGILVSREQYSRVYQDLEKEILATVLFGGLFIAVGILQIGAHNVWGSFSEIVVSALGWGILIKGLLFTIFPAFASRNGNMVAHSNYLWVIGSLVLVLGGYLSWVAYLA